MTEPHDQDNPMQHPEEQPAGTEGGPQFGKLLIVLALAVILMGLVTWVSVEYVTRFT